MNLIPDTPGSTPSYWCTWGAQNYDVDEMNDSSWENAVSNLSESAVFENPGWATHFFRTASRDLFILFDVGWDVSKSVTIERPTWQLGSLEPAEDRFPSLFGSPAERLRGLNDLAKRAGWRGAALWVAAQAVGEGKEGHRLDGEELEAYWRERARWCRAAGIEYWKVDLGVHSADASYRRMVTRVTREEAPELLVEHAVNLEPFNDAPSAHDTSGQSQGRFRAWNGGKVLKQAVNLLTFCDVLRTYDVSNQLANASTLDRVAQILVAAQETKGAGLLNCEDALYLGATLGCALGVMRHPRWRDVEGKDYDTSLSRKRIDEVSRAARWQRLAPAFGVGEAEVTLDEDILTDSWHFGEGETWDRSAVGKEVVQGAPARVARGLPLPEVVPDAEGMRPYVVASSHPNGATAVATLPRTSAERGIHTPLASISLVVKEATAPIGVFGHYQALTLQLPEPLNERRVWGQDLASNEARDITGQVTVNGATVTLSGTLIREVGLAAARSGDFSEPGLVVAIRPSAAGAE